VIAPLQEMSKERRGKKEMSKRSSGMCDHATKGIAKEVKEKSDAHLTTEGIGALWGGHS